MAKQKENQSFVRGRTGATIRLFAIDVTEESRTVHAHKNPPAESAEPSIVRCFVTYEAPLTTPEHTINFGKEFSDPNESYYFTNLLEGKQKGSHIFVLNAGEEPQKQETTPPSRKERTRSAKLESVSRDNFTLVSDIKDWLKKRLGAKQESL